VKHNEDDDLTREPEMVQAYRDTWELGLHSYLTYLRDRLLLARELLAPTGSIFVQISDENLHHVREVMDEVFGAENCVCIITVQKAPYATSSTLPVVADFLCWYAKHKEKVKYRQLFKPKADLDSLDLKIGLRFRLTPKPIVLSLARSPRQASWRKAGSDTAWYRSFRPEPPASRLPLEGNGRWFEPRR